MRPDPLHIWLLIMALYFGIISAACLLTPPSQAVELSVSELSISGNSAGQGLHTLSFLGEHLNASIIQGNNSTWQINATGAM